MNTESKMTLPSGQQFKFRYENGQVVETYQIIDGNKVKVNMKTYEEAVDNDPKIPKK